jgi:hypothetical protein
VNSSFGRLSFQFSAANDWNELQKSLKLETCCFCHTALLYLGQEAVVNENLFSTGLPG